MPEDRFQDDLWLDIDGDDISNEDNIVTPLCIFAINSGG